MARFACPIIQRQIEISTSQMQNMTNFGADWKKRFPDPYDTCPADNATSHFGTTFHSPLYIIPLHSSGDESYRSQSHFFLVS